VGKTDLMSGLTGVLAARAVWWGQIQWLWFDLQLGRGEDSACAGMHLPLLALVLL